MIKPLSPIIPRPQAGQQFYIAQGTGNLGKAKNKTVSWAWLVKELLRINRTAEKFEAFLKLSKEEQDRLKNTNGWWIAAYLKDGKRRNKAIESKRLVVFDMDDCNPVMLDLLTEYLTAVSHLTFVVHSTRKHTSKKPRLRVVFLLKEPLEVEKYNAVCRILAHKLDATMDSIDDVSFRPAQMMFWPGTSIDGEIFQHYNDGELLDAEALLEEFGDWQDYAKLPFSDKQGQKRKSADKAEDPKTKKGPVGAFCRAFSVEAAIERFLSDIYVPGDEESGKPRYTYTAGSTSNGVVVEDDGDFIYSYHTTDPCSDRLCNAWDMVRLHKFADLDGDDPDSTQPGKMASFKAMTEFAQDQEEYVFELAAERYNLSALLGEDDVEGFSEDDDDSLPDEPAGEPEVETAGDDYAEFDDILGSGRPDPLRQFRSRPLPKPKPNWFQKKLAFTLNGLLQPTALNVTTIITHDDRTRGAIAFDDFSKRVVLKRDLITKVEAIPPVRVTDVVNGDRWQDHHDMRIRLMMEAPNGKKQPGYGMKVTDRDTIAAIQMAAESNRFHPVRDYLIDCYDAWDGKSEGAIETFLIRYLGLPDTPYHREVSRLILIASVARIFEPGCKFDFSPVIEGVQGIRKSSFIRALYGGPFFGELTCKLNDVQQIAEAIAGMWAMEFPELASFYKSDHNDAKAFLSRRSDDVRMAYDRRISAFPRQTVFWGTTNDKKYLRDPTGNRRWWILVATVTTIDTDAVEAERDAIWGEAVAAYIAMRQELPRAKGDLFLALSDPEAVLESKLHQEAARTHDIADEWKTATEDFLNRPLKLTTLLAQVQPTNDADDAANAKVQAAGNMLDENMEDVWVVRTCYRLSDILRHVLGRDTDVAMSNNESQTLDRIMSRLEGFAVKANPARRFGILARWRDRLDVSEEDKGRGYKIVQAPVEDVPEFEQDFEDLL